MEIKIAPSILSADFAQLGQEIQMIEQAGADMVHIDVMDGHYVPNITIGPLVVKAIRSISQLPFDVHLMIESPDRYVADFAHAGADIITVHAEACTHLHRTIQLIKQHNVKAGVALNPATPLTALEHIIDDLDMVLVMSVNPGFGGQSFINSALPKISRLRQIIDERQIIADIQVDGGVNEKTAKQVIEAGANILVAGSYLFGKPDMAERIELLRGN